MWAIFLKLIPVFLGWFGIGSKDERDTERAAGEELGAAKAGQAADVGELHDIAKADAARSAVSDDAAAVLRDPANAGPAGPGRTN